MLSVKRARAGQVRLRLPFIILAIAVTALAPHPARAGNQVWTGTSPRAKSIEAIVRDPLNPSRVWAATFGAGVARSLDGGAMWTTYRDGLLNTFVRCVTPQPKHPDSLFCGTNDGVFISLDGGVTWNPLLSTSSSVRAIVVHPVKTGIVYAATYGSGIYKSINGGKNWSQINLGLVNVNVRDVALQPAKPETLLAATGTGGGIHRSLNGGLSWAQVPDTTATNGACEQIQFDALDPSRVYAAELDRGVLKSSDGGLSWVRINRGLTNFRARSLSVVDTLRYVGTDGSGVFFTTLNDTTWHPASTGLAGSIVDALWASASAPGTCWAGTDGFGISRTDNRGASWTQLDGGLLNTFSFSLAIRPSTHEVYGGSGFGDQFWRSASQGVTWTRCTELFTHDSEHGVTPDPLLSQTLYLSAYGSGVYRSNDDGVTWFNPDSLNSSLGNHFVRKLVAWPGQSGHLFVGTGIGVWESLDGGAHWAPRNGGGLPASFSVRGLALVPSGAGTLYAGSDSSGIWKSTDGGNSWAAANAGLPTPFVHDLLVDAANPLTVYAASDSGVFKSVNGGGSWSRASTGLPYGTLGSARALAQDAVHPAVLFCGLFGSGVFESLDGGARWGPVFGNTGLASLNVRALAVDGSQVTLYAGTDDGVAAVSNYVTVASVERGAERAGLALAAWPNPMHAGSVTIQFALPQPGRASLEVFGVNGRRLRTLARGQEGAGAHVINWDRRDADGRELTPGIYFLRLDTPVGARTDRLAITEP